MPDQLSSQPACAKPWIVPQTSRRQPRKLRRFVKPISIYLREEHYRELAARASNQHHTLSRYARQSLLRTMRRSLPTQVETLVLTAIEDALVELRCLRVFFASQEVAAQKLDQILESLAAGRDAVRLVPSKSRTIKVSRQTKVKTLTP